MRSSVCFVEEASSAPPQQAGQGGVLARKVAGNMAVSYSCEAMEPLPVIAFYKYDGALRSYRRSSLR